MYLSITIILLGAGVEDFEAHDQPANIEELQCGRVQDRDSAIEEMGSERLATGWSSKSAPPKSQLS